MTYKITAFALTFLLACSAQAESLPKKKDFTHDFTVGVESFHYHYDETTKEHKKFMEFNSMMYGLNGAYQLTYKDSIFFRPEARWGYGHADYKSARGSKSSIKHVPTFIFETRLLGGVPFKASSHLTISLYTGLGYRYKSDDATDMKSKDNIASYKRINKLWYIPLGVRLHYDFENRWFLQSLTEYDWMIQGRHLTYDKHYAPSPLVCKQKRGWGAKVELLGGYHFDKVSMSFGPYINYWKIQKSSTEHFTYYNDAGDDYPNVTGIEPANMTKEMGVKLNFVF